MAANGQLPRSALAPIWDGKLLEHNAARAFNAMDAEAVSHHGRHIGVSDAYRSKGWPGDLSRGRWSQWAAWERYHQGGNLAAVPGTSNHGWGVAVDATSDGTVLIRLDGNRHGWDHGHTDAPSEWWHHRWDGHTAPPKPPPSPFRHMPAHMREACERALYHRRRRIAEGRTGHGPKWRKQDRWVRFWVNRVKRLHKRAKDPDNKRLLQRVLDDRNGEI